MQESCIDPSNPSVLDSCSFDLNTSRDKHQHLPSLPDLYPLQEQDLFLAADDMETTEKLDTQTSTNIFNMDVNDISAGVTKSSRKAICHMNKCFGEVKSFFMLSADDLLCDEITDDIILNGKIIFAPKKEIQVRLWESSYIEIIFFNNNISNMEKRIFLILEAYPVSGAGHYGKTHHNIVFSHTVTYHLRQTE